MAWQLVEELFFGGFPSRSRLFLTGGIILEIYHLLE